MCFSICSLYHIRYYEEMNPSYTGSRCFRILQVFSGNAPLLNRILLRRLWFPLPFRSFAFNNRLPLTYNPVGTVPPKIGNRSRHRDRPLRSRRSLREKISHAEGVESAEAVHPSGTVPIRTILIYIPVRSAGGQRADPLTAFSPTRFYQFRCWGHRILGNHPRKGRANGIPRGRHQTPGA